MLVERPFIRCATCKSVSYNENDIAQRYCGRCHKFHEGPDSYELGTKNEKAKRTEIRAMVTACSQLLGHEELTLVARALNESPELFMREAVRHTGVAVSPTTWAKLVLSCARLTLVVREIEDAISRYYAQERRADVRRAVLDERDPQLFEVLTEAVGTLDDDDWSQLVVRCIGVALELADEKETMQ